MKKKIIILAELRSFSQVQQVIFFDLKKKKKSVKLLCDNALLKALYK